MNDSTFMNPSDDFVRKVDIHELLPQQEPFVMIGHLTHFDERFTVTETEVKEGNLFVEAGHFTASGLIENIAQTCAARIGFVNKYILKKDIQIGFIGAVRELEIRSLPQVGDIITTEVEVLEEIFGMTLAHATVTCGGQLLVTTEMKIAVKEKEDEKQG